jgi:hypothetical protein
MKIKTPLHPVPKFRKTVNTKTKFLLERKPRKDSWFCPISRIGSKVV